VGNPDYKLREHQSNYGDEYTYDNLYRLTRSIYDDATPATPTASPSASTTDDFMYDDIGNRTKCYLKDSNDTTYLANAVNEYTKSTLDGTDTFYGHDAAGNLTRVAAAEGSDTDGDWRYYYDHENFLTKAEKYDTDSWATQAAFVRDALGRRIEKVAGETTIRYYLDGVRIIEETEGTESPTVERQYVFGNGIDEALVMFDKDGESYNAYYYLADRMWTVEAMVDEDAAIVEAYAYRAYGEPTINTGDGGDGDWFDGDETTCSCSAYSKTILFTGRNWDSEIALYYYRARMYNPLSGRFLSRDGAGYRDGPNLFEYARSRPLVFLDPLGMGLWDEFDRRCGPLGRKPMRCFTVTDCTTYLTCLKIRCTREQMACQSAMLMPHLIEAGLFTVAAIVVECATPIKGAGLVVVVISGGYEVVVSLRDWSKCMGFKDNCVEAATGWYDKCLRVGTGKP